MKIIRNIGTDRVIDLLRPQLTTWRQCDLITSMMSLFAFSELVHELAALDGCRLVLPPTGSDLALLGSDADRAARNRLQTRWLARRLAQWIENKADVRRAVGAVPQGAFVVRDGEKLPLQALLGSLAFSTDLLKPIENRLRTLRRGLFSVRYERLDLLFNVRFNFVRELGTKKNRDLSTNAGFPFQVDPFEAPSRFSELKRDPIERSHEGLKRITPDAITYFSLRQSLHAERAPPEFIFRWLGKSQLNFNFSFWVCQIVKDPYGLPFWFCFHVQFLKRE